MKGPGKYDDECSALLKSLRADVVMLIVLGGERRSGFSVSAHISQRARLREHGPDMLRSVADQLATDLDNELS